MAASRRGARREHVGGGEGEEARKEHHRGSRWRGRRAALRERSKGEVSGGEEVGTR